MFGLSQRQVYEVTVATANVIDHDYSPRGACHQLFKTQDDEVLLSGPAGTGKSRACLEKLHAMALQSPSMRGLIVRKTATSLTASALKTWTRDVAKESLAAGAIRFYGGSTEKPPAYQFENGSEIAVGGMDRASRVLSTDFDVIYIQEATELSLEDWETLTTRLRNGVLSFQQIIADCNPDTANHWLLARCNEGSTTMLKSLHTDNPRLYTDKDELTAGGKAYIGKLEKLTGIRRARLLEGKWVSAEGVIYDEYESQVHLVNRFPVPDDWPRSWAIDWGFTNPTVIQCWAEDPDGRLFLYREIYHTQRLVSDHAAQLMSIVKPGGEVRDGRYVGGEWIEPKPSRVVADHDPEAQEQFRRVTGISVRDADKAVAAGIQAVQKRLRVAGDGKPRLFVMRESTVERDPVLSEAWRPTGTAEEFGSYVWSDKKEETPVKEHDHGMDAMRYLVVAADRPTAPRFRWI